ncbi:uncharacterized protein IL334_006333 [Kwoniella shivajii]|uniref:Uncharacterized protein n=1 Tax=Kwoniella shivajii TaxID=564305 RepID=A0ABZ1D7R4_9TREE|nr:hypothetical protein IL334_006333 [Kwoniella shivajii]
MSDSYSTARDGSAPLTSHLSPLSSASHTAQKKLDKPSSSQARSESSTRTVTPEEEKSDPSDKLAPQQEIDDHDDLSGHDQTDKQSHQHGTMDGRETVEEDGADGVDDLEALKDRKLPDPRKVHWKSRLRDHSVVDMRSVQRSGSPTMTSEDANARNTASRLVRKHTGRPPIAPRAPEADDDSDGTNVPSSSAVSLNSTDSPVPDPRHRRMSSRRSSFSSSVWETSDEETDDDTRVGPGGVLSALLGLYRNDTSEKRRGTLRSLMSGKREHGTHKQRTRRRWSSQSLFTIPSANSSFAGSRRSSMNHTDDISGTDLEERLKYEARRVHRNRKHQTLPHRSQDLNDPYIPSPHFSNQMRPHANITISQRFSQFMVGHANPATWFRYNEEQSHPAQTHRAMAALVITTSSLVAIATPKLSHVAPAYGGDAETSGGTRKISYYEGVAESQAKQEDQQRREDEELGMNDGTDLEKDMEEGRLRGRNKRQRRRGKRTQKELAVTKHVSNIIQRKK